MVKVIRTWNDLAMCAMVGIDPDPSALMEVSFADTAIARLRPRLRGRSVRLGGSDLSPTALVCVSLLAQHSNAIATDHYSLGGCHNRPSGERLAAATHEPARETELFVNMCPRMPSGGTHQLQ